MKPDKLSLNLKGPYKIINIDRERYTLLNLVDDKIITTHRLYIRPFKKTSEITLEQVLLKT